MRKTRSKPAMHRNDELRPEYDFSHAMPNKFARRYAEGTNLVLLDAEVAEVFTDSRAVNEALRPLAKIIRMRHKLA